MSWTINDVIIQTREILQDVPRTDANGIPVEGTRHSNAKLIRYVNTALSEVRRLRPDAYIGDDTAGTIANIDTTDTVLDEYSDFPLEEQFFMPFISYVTGMVGLGDDEFAQDGRAVGLLNAFKLSLVGSQATS